MLLRICFWKVQTKKMQKLATKCVAKIPQIFTPRPERVGTIETIFDTLSESTNKITLSQQQNSLLDRLLRGDNFYFTGST